MQSDHRSLALACLCSIASLGCGNAGSTQHGSTERDSAGIRVVTSSVEAVRNWRLQDGYLLQLGAVQGDGPYLFDRINAAFRLSDGRIVVADGGSLEIRWFDEKGTHLLTVGGRGDGPGEFRGIHSVVRLPNDTLLVHDGWNARVTTISPDGVVAGVAPTPGLLGIGGGRAIIGRVPDGRLLMALKRTPDPLTHTTGQMRDTMLIALARQGDPPTDTIVRLQSTRRVAVPDNTMDFGHLRILDYFTPEAHAAIWNGSIITGTAETYELRVFDVRGQLTSIVRRTDAPPVHVKGPMQDAYFAAVEAAGGPRSVQTVREQQARFAIDRTVPSYSQILVDDVGNLWVREYTLPEPVTQVEYRWTIFDMNGTARARVTTPPGFQPLHITEGYVLGRVRDQLNVQYVQLYRFIPH